MSNKILNLFAILIIIYSIFHHLNLTGIIMFSPPGMNFDYFASSEEVKMDFVPYYLAAKNIASGQDIYDRETHIQAAEDSGLKEERILPYIYLPILAIFLAPFSFLNYQTAEIVWLLLNQILLFFSIFLIARIIQIKFKLINIAIILFLVTNFYPVYNTFDLGQVNFLILFLIAGSYYFFKKGNDILAGILLALAANIKIIPCLFILFFLWKRKYKIVLSAVVSIIILLLFSISIVGVESHIEYFKEIVPKTIEPQIAFFHNQSVHGLFRRIFTENYWTKPLLENYYIYLILAFFASLAILFYGFYICRGDIKRKDKRFDLEFSLFIIISLLVSSISWEHHFVILLIPYFILFYYFFKNKISLNIFILFILSFVLIAIQFYYWAEPFTKGIALFLTGIKLYATLLLFFIIIRLLKISPGQK